MTLEITTTGRVRVLTLARPEALNAFNEALYDATTEALLEAAQDPEVAVVVVTGAGRAFSAGTDLKEMQARVTATDFTPGGTASRVDRRAQRLREAADLRGQRNRVGIGTTILGYADLAFMSSTARLMCPFTSLGVAPEARRRICCRD